MQSGHRCARLMYSINRIMQQKQNSLSFLLWRAGLGLFRGLCMGPSSFDIIETTSPGRKIQNYWKRCVCLIWMCIDAIDSATFVYLVVKVLIKVELSDSVRSRRCEVNAAGCHRSDPLNPARSFFLSCTDLPPLFPSLSLHPLADWDRGIERQE